MGPMKVRTTTLNQNDEAVQVIIANLVVPRRPTQGGIVSHGHPDHWAGLEALAERSAGARKEQRKTHN
jgi:metal-dependent hydrolase (beta-lactamase superfamily II)